MCSTGECYWMEEISPGLYRYIYGPCESLPDGRLDKLAPRAHSSMLDA